METTQVHDNPLVQRYAGKEMVALWNPANRYSTWRKLWVALAQTQMELGLLSEDGTTPRISPLQIKQLEQNIHNIDFARVEEHEQRLRHDVMAHIHAYGECCPLARDIIHLGATSCFVTDNTELILMRQGLTLLQKSLVGLLDHFAKFSRKYAGMETLGFTHFQPATFAIG